jgi:hypothetical protein
MCSKLVAVYYVARHRPAAEANSARACGAAAAERVADDVRHPEAGLVHRTLDRVDEAGFADLALDRRAARVARQGRRQDVVIALQCGQHELPAAPGVHEAVQAYQRRPSPSAVRRGGRRLRLREAHYGVPAGYARGRPGRMARSARAVAAPG